MRSLRMTLSLVLVLFLTGSAWGVMFNFDSLAAFSGPDAISNYMSNEYGSQVSVYGARVGPTSTGDPFGSDSYLFSMAMPGETVFFPFSIDIGFGGNPIESIRFDGAIFGDNPGHDFRAWAYTDGGNTLVSVQDWNISTDSELFDSGLIIFDVPIDRLVFSDNWMYDVAIDNLQVTAWGEGSNGGIHVPVPASTLLGIVGLGFTGMMVFVRRKVLQTFASVD